MQLMNIHILLEREVKEGCVEFSNAEKRFGQFEKKKVWDTLTYEVTFKNTFLIICHFRFNQVKPWSNTLKLIIKSSS